MGRVPPSIKVVSILCIIYAGVGILIALFGIIQIFHPLYSDATSKALTQDPVIVKISLAASAARIVLGGLLLASAIGALKVKRWGRVGLNIYAILYVLDMLALSTVQMIYILPKTLEALKGQPNMTDQVLRIAGIASIVGVVLTVLWALGIALTILITFNRKTAVNAFNGILLEDNSPNDQPTGGVV